MKFIVLFSLLAFSARAAVVEKDRTITQVVKLLQGMLDKSKAEGDEERKIYSKFKCFCDTSEAEKSDSIKQLTEQISILESQIAELQGDNGELSSEVAELKASMADNAQARNDATALRNKENRAFLAEEKDLTEAIAQMKAALETLSAVGGDQTKGAGADNKQFMAGKAANLLSLQSHVADALKAASSLMSPKQRSTAAAFLQAPFTGTYSSQSGAVVGILKNMRDTFKSNLGDARTSEKNAAKVYSEFMEVKEDAFKSMKASYEDKQKALGDNDGELSSKKQALSQAENSKASDEEFLGSLLPMCADRAAGYANRKLLRANEEAAIAQAVSILNSDAAFETFGTTDATKSGAKAAALIQKLRSVRRHETADMHVRSMAKEVLETAAKQVQSARLAKVVALLQGANPFDTVLGEIEKMISLIAAEAASDKKNLDWCNSERKENNGALADRKKEILSLESSIDKLSTTIENPKTGLKALIQELEENLVQNTESQTTETRDRTEANVAYQGDVRNLVSAQSILTKGIKVLSAYYDDLEKKLAAGDAFVQKKEDPKAPESWKGDGAYKGQSDQGGDVISMLNFILSETQKEETDAHQQEEKAQADYEDSMTTLKSEEAKAEKSLSEKQATLASTEQELLEAQDDLKQTTNDKEAIEAYLVKIQPGCDFITKNFSLRENNRKTEKAALEKAVGLIRATPAYKTAVNAATVESYGDCKEPCVKDADDVNCKACQADVTIPAYCAGHKGTKGC